jgi:hypothetical protein
MLEKFARSFFNARPKKGRQEVLALLPKHAVGAEIGVWKGNFSADIVRCCEPRKLYLIDPWTRIDAPAYKAAKYGRHSAEDIEAVYRSTIERFEKDIKLGRVIVLRKKSTEALIEFPDDYFDFLYLDGDHTYEGVSADIALAKQKVRMDGLICGDDYNLKGWWGDGVVRAVHEALAAGGLAVQMIRSSQYVLKRIRK